MPRMRLTDFQAVLFDMDGTLYHDDHVLPGAVDTISYLEANHVPFACLTNAGWRTPGQLVERLASMGITLPSDRLYTAGQAVADWILSNWQSPRVCNFAGSALERLLDGKVQWVTQKDQPCDVVAVAGHMHAEGGQMNMPRALCALSHLRNGAQMVVTCRDRVYPVPDGFAIGSGSVAAMFAYAANLPDDRVHYVGKPNPSFFKLLCERLGVEPAQCLLVGDNLESDIKGGLTTSMTTALVLSGVTTRPMLESSDIQPAYVFDDLADMLQVTTASL